jgi:pre-mRNA-processing factor 19
MLETYTLKQHLDTTRQELSQALYQHDAACRVIAKLMKERDEARAMLNALQTQGINVTAVSDDRTTTENGSNNHAAAPAEDMEVVPQTETKLAEDVLSRIMDKCSELSKGRKGRKAPADLTSRENVCNFSESEVWTPHSSKSGITSMKVIQNPSDNHLLSLTGGVDKIAILTDLTTGQVLSKLNGHSKRVNCVALTSQGSRLAITGSADRQVKVWQPAPGDSDLRYSESLTFAKHESDVTGLALHPTGPTSPHFPVLTSL